MIIHHPQKMVLRHGGLCLRLCVARLPRSHRGGELALSARLLDVASQP